MAIAGVNGVPPFEDYEKKVSVASRKYRIVRAIGLIKEYDVSMAIERVWNDFENSVDEVVNDGYVKSSNVQVMVIKNSFLLIFQEFANKKMFWEEVDGSLFSNYLG